MGMHFQEKFLLALYPFIALILALAGLWAEHSCVLSNGFARSGSVIMCVGFCFAFLDLREVIEDKYEAMVNYLKLNKPEIEIVLSDDEIEKKGKGTTYTLQKQAKVTKKKNVRLVKVVDTLVLVSGTLIWGFGGLLLGCPC